MPNIDNNIIERCMCVDPTHKIVRQKRRSFSAEKYAAINKEVKRLLVVGFIKKAHYPEWLSNIVLVVPFGLKNAGTTYQRLVNRMFNEQIGKSVKVYVEDLLVKSKEPIRQLDDLRVAFGILRRYRMRLNPAKCAFEVESRKFFRFIISERGIEASSKKIEAILNMKLPRNLNETHRLAGRMDKSWMQITDRFGSREYAKGIKEFLTLAQSHATSEVERHLFIKGIDKNYTVWIFHGEEKDLIISDDDDDLHDLEQEDDFIDNVDVMLRDIRAGKFPDVPITESFHAEDSSSVDINSSRTFNQLLADSRRPLYEGCTKYSKLSFTIKLLHIKTLGGWSVKYFDMFLHLLKSAFPNALLPISYKESRNLEKGLGFTYNKIHVCSNDCILHWRKYADKDECPKCKLSKWKFSGSKKRRIPQKVLRHFPLKPRLQRLFMSQKTAADMRWHKDQRVIQQGILSHPADFEVWTTFDQEHAWFVEDPRNIHFFITSLLIPGPRSPGNEIDVYLQHLIDELIDLWDNGVGTYDTKANETFQLHATLLWTINDFPAYGNLSGWSTKGKVACPSCKEQTDSMWLTYSRKHYYMCHRRFLPSSHIWRKKKTIFNGNTEHRDPPTVYSGEDILIQLQNIRDANFGKAMKKRKRTIEEFNWTKKSIFFQLPYWPTIKIRHNLNVMHIEKNICDNIIGTLMNILGNSKDHPNTCRDLFNLNIRNELHLIQDGQRISMPHACYTLYGVERTGFCSWLHDVKFSDGFASNIARCISVPDCKSSGMKSHHCHIFMQRLLHAAISGYLRQDVRLTLIELSTFFKELHARTCRVDILEKLQADIAIILCKLEIIFPPTFFDIMVHLAYHLPHEALLAGSVQYRWMYPFERYFRKFKRYVKNKPYPEGSIAEAYIHVECSNFCSMYLNDVETRFNPPEHNVDEGDEGV
ncbi:uncharacterized protein LOC122304580 [Carya illinoinensis]|uniref:uncharacterized protein LOC122304580 n=1 Tax=Carya illinoinensis TaxID=32201 RepID=UPI001C7215B8|nr:uncharacterized protein LOC122304580 [Carya illinoinensis]